MADQRNRYRGIVFRGAVARSLQHLGVEGAEARTTATLAVSEAAAAGTVLPDVAVPGSSWFIATRSDLTPTFGPSLDSAVQGAALSGARRGALVQYRPGRGVEDSFVVVALRDFAAILKRDAADWDSLSEFEKWARVQQSTEE